MPDEDNLAATAILDFGDRALSALARELRATHTGGRDFLRAAHSEITSRVRPVYSLNELQPVSVTLRTGRGSCSQRMAVLEALARAVGIASCVHVLWIKGSFWYPRFSPLLSVFVPKRVLLVWPRFWIDQKWVGFEELYETLDQLVAQRPQAFANVGESLFDAVARMPIDFHGTTCSSCGPRYDLSKFLIADGGSFARRDDVFRKHRPFQHTLRGRVFELIFGGRKSS